MKAPSPFPFRTARPTGRAAHLVDADAPSSVPAIGDVLFEIAVVLSVTLAIALATNLALEIAGLQ